MAESKRYLFVSYAAEDRERVQPLVDAVSKELESRAIPVDVWMDMTRLRPGEQFDVAITNALDSSIGFLFFVSRSSLRSEWVHRELVVASMTSDRLIIPVVLDERLDVPSPLALRQALSFVGPQTKQAIAEAASQIADATKSFLRSNPNPRAPVAPSDAPRLANEIAQQVRAPVEPVPEQTEQKSVFVVHGHDNQALEKLEAYLRDCQEISRTS